MKISVSEFEQTVFPIISLLFIEYFQFWHLDATEYALEYTRGKGVQDNLCLNPCWLSRNLDALDNLHIKITPKFYSITPNLEYFSWAIFLEQFNF